MGTYNGGATVIVGAVEYEVGADLHSTAERNRVRSMGGSSSLKGLTSWGGTLDTDDEAAWNIMNGGVLPLRLPNDNEGRFHAYRRSGGTLWIRGRGNPPF